MRIDAAYPSKYLKHADLQDRPVRVTIERFEIEEIGDGDRKPCLYFAKHDRGLVLNRTNADSIAAVFGDETDEWIGQVIELYPDKTRFAGKMVDCIRVRVPRIETARTIEPKPTPPRNGPRYTERNPPPADALDDEVPF